MWIRRKPVRELIGLRVQGLRFFPVLCEQFDIRERPGRVLYRRIICWVEEEIARVVRFLASDEAGYITGHVLNVNGGMYM